MPMLNATALIADQLANPSSGWAIGAFGAIGEFMRDADEAVELAGDRAITLRGAIALSAHPACRAIAYETSMGADAWSGALALCLPEADAAIESRGVLTELGEDRDAIRPNDRRARLFDMGLGLPHVEACVRSDDPAIVETLRAYCGRSLMSDAFELFLKMPALSPNRVFASRLGRTEIFQPIPTEHGRTPEGPHTHVLPKLLKARRAHAADVPIPAGWVAAATIYPANPLRDVLGRPKAFTAHEHQAWTTLFDAYSLDDLREVKRATIEHVERGEAPDAATSYSRVERLAIRVALRQYRVVRGDSTVLASWRTAFDRPEGIDPDAPPGH
jgi:hypothetical protein